MQKLTAVIITILVIVGNTFAQKPMTYDEAKELSKLNNKPILLEFYRDD